MGATVLARAETANSASATTPLPRVLSAQGVARLELFSDMKSAEPHWRRLEKTGVLTPYQHFDWVAAWQQNIGIAESITPLLLAGFDPGGDPLFLLPLGYQTKARFRIAHFLGGKHANYNFGPWCRDFSVSADMLRALIDWLAEARPELDGLELLNQPENWNGTDNPFCLLSHQQSPSDGYRLSLGGDEKEVTARVFTSNRRKRLRYRERKLDQIPGYRYVRASNAAEIERYLQAFFIQKASRLAHQGIKNVFAAPGVESFVRDLCLKGLDDGKPALEIHALDCDAEVISIFACVNDGERLSSMFNSYGTGEAARFSPGVVLLSHIIRNCIERRIPGFDLGVGEAEYKTYFCDELEPLFDTYLGLSPRGQLVTATRSAKAALKRRIKRSPALLKFALTLRRLRAGKPQSGGEES